MLLFPVVTQSGKAALKTPKLVFPDACVKVILDILSTHRASRGKTSAVGCPAMADRPPEFHRARSSAGAPVGLPQFVFQIACLTFGIFLLAQAGAWFVRTTPGIVSPVWPAGGLALAAALLYGLERVLPAVYLGTVASSFLSGDPLLTAYAGPMASVLNVSIGWFILTRCLHVDSSLGSLSDFIKLVLGGCTLGPAVAGLVETLLWNFGHQLATSQLVGGFLEKWQAHAFGVLVFCPFFLFALRRQDFSPATTAGKLSLLGCAVALAGILIYMAGWIPPHSAAIALLGMAFALALTVSFVFGLRPACLFQAVFVFLVPAAFVMFPERTRDLHLFRQGDDQQTVINGLAFFSSLGCLLIAAFRDELTSVSVKFALALQAADVCIWEWNPEGWSCLTPAWRTKLGLPNGRVLPERLWRDIVHPADRTAFDSSFDELRNSGTGRWSHAYRIRDARDRWIWVHSHAQPIRRDADNGLLVVAGVTRDITQERTVMQTRINAIEAEAELKSLRSQLNPHFLFNALNSVRALIGRHDDRARQMIVSLSNLLRELLSSRDGRAQTVDKELEMVHDYLAIEAIRFGPRLQQEIRCETGLGGQLIPSMLILTLVENAVKHGISKIERGGRIEVDIRRGDTPNTISLSVINDGRLTRTPGGFGLANSRRRIALIAGNAGSLTLREIDGARVEACAILPLDERRAAADPLPPTPTTA